MSDTSPPLIISVIGTEETGDENKRREEYNFAYWAEDLGSSRLLPARRFISTTKL